MSALAEQHENWAEARSRLWTVPPPKPMAYIPPKPVNVLEPSAPFNFLKAPSWLAIVKLISLRHCIGIAEILGPSRRVNIVQARQQAMYLVHTHCQKSLPEIGRLFGGRDHTTALHSIRKIERLRAQATASDSPAIHSSIPPSTSNMRFGLAGP